MGRRAKPIEERFGFKVDKKDNKAVFNLLNYLLTLSK